MMDFRTRRGSSRTLADGILVGLAGLALAASAWSALRSRGELGSVRAALGEVRAEVASAQARLRSLTAHRSTEGERLASRLELTAQAPPTRLLAEITSLLPEQVRLRSVSFGYGEVVAVDLEVEARSAAAWDEFLDRLSRSRRFSSVRPGEEQRDGEVHASLRMTWIGEGSSACAS